LCCFCRGGSYSLNSLPLSFKSRRARTTAAGISAPTSFWARFGKKFEDATPIPPVKDYLRQKEDPVTRDFIAYLKTEPLLKAILAGHEHVMVQDRFSPTAEEFVVGANFMFCGREVLFI
jgi:hypothetical protein